MRKFISRTLWVLALCSPFISPNIKAQEDSIQYQVLDEVIAVLGAEIVIASELRDQMLQYSEQFGRSANQCQVFEQLLTQKLFLHNAKVDSVDISDDQVEAEMDRRMRYFIQQIGSQKKLEEFYGKSIVQLKEEFRDQIREVLLVQGLQQEVSSKVKVTPAEVKDFFEEIPEDSLPLVNSQIEMAQLVIYPKINPQEKQRARSKLEEIRKDILGGKDFATQAVLYSDDPGSAAKGGDLGMVEKGQFVPEFDAVALSLQDGQLSQVFESQFGFHLMQMLERRGEKYRSRHILIKPKVTREDENQAKNLIDSLASVLDKNPDQFQNLVGEYSEDEDSKNSGGIIVNQANGTSRFDMAEIDGQLFFVVDDLEKGEISEVHKFTSMGGKEGYRIIKLNERTTPHRANLHDDYQILQEAAAAELKAAALQDYIERKIQTTYVRVNEEYQSCPFIYEWFKEN
ncbi:MAG: peptidylprolyl isomerase [Luteibaculum sp.]